MRLRLADLCNAFARPLRSDGGNVAVLFAVLLPLIIGGAGVGIETTYWRYEQLQLQSAADAAAFAGGVERRAGATTASITDAATLAATQNGFNPASGSIDVNLPGTAKGAAAPSALEVILHAQAPRFFTAAFVNTPVQLSARAVAVFNASSSACILALDPSAPQAVLLSGNASLTLQGCSVMANSIASDAILVKNAADLTAPCIASGGGVSLVGDVTLGCSSAVVQAPRAADPYAAVAAPTASGACLSDNSATLVPGRYCAGISLNKDTAFQPGVYYVSGDFSINGNADITGTGVTIYLQGAARVTINGAANVQLSAPTSGPYAGILFFADRASAGGTNLFSGNAGSRMTGVFYFPTQNVDYRGNYSGQGGCTQIVARTVTWTGSSSVSVSCAAAGMQPIPVLSVVKLVE